jgi:hypothetical protein
MIAGGIKWIGHIFDDTGSVVIDRAGFSVHESVCANDFSSEGMADGLMSQTHSEYW